MPNRVVHVEIQGQRYAVRSELEPSYIAELAAYVDEKMRLAAIELQNTDPTRIAVIAALNVADELFRARADGSGFEGRLFQRTAEIERLVDTVLADARLRAVNE
jgi:cell division protein ZapA